MISIARVPDPSVRAQILMAGLELMGTQGYSATSVAQVCKKSGTHVGSLYHHFGSKAGLLAEILDRGVHRLSEGIGRAAAVHGSGTIEALFLGAADAIAEEILFYRLTLFVILEHPEETDVVGVLERFRTATGDAIATMIEPFALAAGIPQAQHVTREITDLTIELTRGAIVAEKFSLDTFRGSMTRNAHVVEMYLQSQTSARFEQQ